MTTLMADELLSIERVAKGFHIQRGSLNIAGHYCGSRRKSVVQFDPLLAALHSDNCGHFSAGVKMASCSCHFKDKLKTVLFN